MATQNKHIAAYVKSNPNNSALSVEQLEKRILMLLKAQNCVDVSVYKDGLIQKTDKVTRTGIFSLLDDVQFEKIKSVWVLDIQDIIFEGELGRQILKELSNAKIPIFSFKDSEETVRHNIMQIITTSAAAQKSNTTKLRSLEKGKAPAGRAAFGYERIDSETESTTKLIVRVEKAEIVKKIFADYLKFKSMAKVAEILRKDNIPAPAGANWSRASVAWILKNEIYIGIVKYASKKRKGEHKPLIDPKTFEAVQALRNKNRRASKHQTLTDGPYKNKKAPTEVSLKIVQDALELDDVVIETNEVNTKTMTSVEIGDKIKKTDENLKKRKNKLSSNR